MASTNALGAFDLGSNPSTPTKMCGCRISVLPELSKLMRGVRLPSPAPAKIITPNKIKGCFFYLFYDKVR